MLKRRLIQLAVKRQVRFAEYVLEREATTETTGLRIWMTTTTELYQNLKEDGREGVKRIYGYERKTKRGAGRKNAA